MVEGWGGGNPFAGFDQFSLYASVETWHCGPQGIEVKHVNQNFKQINKIKTKIIGEFF